MNQKKLFKKLQNASPNTRFDDLVSVVEAFGFRLDRVSGSHHIFKHDDISELLNLQTVKGKAKPYQIRQFLALVDEYNLSMEDDA